MSATGADRDQAGDADGGPGTSGEQGGTVQRWSTAVVAAVSAAVAAVVSVATTLAVLRLTGDDLPVRPLAGVPASAAPAAAGVIDLPVLFGRVSSGVVRIETTACVLGGAGTGFLVARDLVVTAAHVVDGAHAVVLRRDDGTGVEARVVGLDTLHDVAMLRATRPIDGHVFSFAVGPPQVGADVAILGYPLDGPLVPLRRTVTGTGQSLDVSGSGTTGGPDTVVRDLLRVDGGFQGGNSGGPVLRADGKVLGFVEGRSLASTTTGYAVSAAAVLPSVEQWRRLTTSLDVADRCDAPVGPAQSRVTVRDTSTSPLGPLVADFYGRYASAVNSARYAQAWDLLTDRARGTSTYEDWVQAERSSQIFDVTVLQVAPGAPGVDPTPVPAVPSAGDPAASPASPSGPVTVAPSAAASSAESAVPVVTPGEGGSLHALLEFSTTQEDRLGPGGQTCSRWRVTYTFARQDGQWRIDDSARADGFPQPC
jgi:S1-C subfamily serine protease